MFSLKQYITTFTTINSSVSKILNSGSGQRTVVQDLATPDGENTNCKTQFVFLVCEGLRAAPGAVNRGQNGGTCNVKSDSEMNRNTAIHHLRLFRLFLIPDLGCWTVMSTDGQMDGHASLWPCLTLTQF